MALEIICSDDLTSEVVMIWNQGHIVMDMAINKVTNSNCWTGKKLFCKYLDVTGRQKGLQE